MKKNLFAMMVILAIAGQGVSAQTAKGKLYTELNINASYLSGLNDLNKQVFGHYESDGKMVMRSGTLGVGLGYMFTDGLSAFANGTFSVGTGGYGRDGSTTMHAVQAHLCVDYDFRSISRLPFSVYAGIGCELVNYASTMAPYGGVAVNATNAYIPLGLTWWMSRRLGLSAQYTLPVVKGGTRESNVYSNLPTFSTQGITLGLKARF